MEEEILDYETPKTPRSKWINTTYGVSIAFLVYSFIADIARWPGKDISLLIGLFLLLIITVVNFFRRKGRALFEWAYFIGKVTLIAAIYLKLARYPQAYTLIYITFGCFAFGLLALSLERWRRS